MQNPSKSGVSAASGGGSEQIRAAADHFGENASVLSAGEASPQNPASAIDTSASDSGSESRCRGTDAACAQNGAVFAPGRDTPHKGDTPAPPQNAGCFAGGMMILTKSGYRPIEDLEVGDEVLGGDGILRTITRTAARTAASTLVAHVATRGKVRCTECHLFPSSANMGVGKRIDLGPPDKTRMADVAGRYLYRLDRRKIAHIEHPPLPRVEGLDDDDVIEICGWYVGDGYIGRNKRKEPRSVVLCLNGKKLENFDRRFAGRLKYRVYMNGGLPDVSISNRDLAEFMLAEFSEYCESKRIPLWCYTLPERQVAAFIEGYFRTDGTRDPKRGVRFTTVSPALAYGITDMMDRSCVSLQRVKPTCTIKGRTYPQKPLYNIVRSDNPRVTHITDFGTAVRCKKIVRDLATATVYDIGTDGDGSYVANGLIAYGCADLSCRSEGKERQCAK